MPAHPLHGGLAAAVTAVLTSTAGATEPVEPVTVTATRTPTSANESLTSVTVLDRADIESSSARSLPDLLGRQSGISLSQNGAYGKASSVFMRGTNSDHVLVLIDGVKLGSATLGSTAFQHLPLDQIERIEIARGPRSSLYGSEAIGGVIQIFTRSGSAGDLQVETSGMRASNGTNEVTTGIAGGDNTTRMAVSGKKLDSDGIDTTEPGFPDEDGYSNDSASGSLTHELTDAATISVNALTASGESGYDPNPAFGVGSENKVEQFEQRAVTSELDLQATSWWSMSFSGGRTTDESRNLTDGNFDSKFETDRDEASWQNDFTIGTSHLLTLGYDYRHDRVTSSRDYDETERDNHAAFGQWQWTGEAVDTEVSVRHDDNEAFGTESTGSLAGGIRVAEATRVFASYGTGFKTPTFNDLYYPDTAFFESNPDLDPEHSRSLELGARGSGSVSWNASLYRTEIENLIVNVDPDGFGGQPGSPENVREAEINGLELGIQGEHGGWDLGANATLLDTEIVTSQGGANDGNELPRRPERKFTFDFARPIGPVRLSAHIQHESDRFDDAANTTELEGFTRVDFALDYRVTQGLELRAGVENLSDADYQTADGFETPGRTARLRLSYRM